MSNEIYPIGLKIAQKCSEFDACDSDMIYFIKLIYSWGFGVLLLKNDTNSELSRLMDEIEK